MLLIVSDELEWLMDMNDHMISLKAEWHRTRGEDEKRLAALIEDYDQEIQNLQERNEEEAWEYMGQFEGVIYRWRSNNVGGSWQVCVYVRMFLRHNRHYVVVVGLPASWLCTATQANPFSVPNLLGNRCRATIRHLRRANTCSPQRIGNVFFEVVHAGSRQ